jgi:aspartyl-tRNA(Asn)/glutamyl-tRNA(Gln) amidotransferase subunit A
MDSVFFYRNTGKAASSKGALQKMKIALQPNICVTGWPTEAGSKALAGFHALENAAVVEKIAGEGAEVAGYTRMSEFGFGLKESMAGVACQKNLADAELVLDLAGEARIAAARAGVCGFKPSYGLVSRFGLAGLIPSMEAYGILSAEIKNIRDILQAIAGPDERDSSLPEEKTPELKPAKIDPAKTTLGVIKDILKEMPAKERESFDGKLNEFKKAGFAIKELSFPDFSQFLAVHKIVGSVEASSCAGRYDSVRYGKREPGAKNWNEMYLSSRGAAFGTLLKSYLIQGSYFQFESYAAYENACRLRSRLVNQMKKLTAQADFLILPVVNRAAAQNPATIAETYAQFIYTAFANVTGQPALYLPDKKGEDLQLTAARLADARLLALGEYLLGGGGK